MAKKRTTEEREAKAAAVRILGKLVSPGAALVAKRWKKTTPAERSAFASKVAAARWSGKPTVPCPRCDAPCRSIRAARAHCAEQD